MNLRKKNVCVLFLLMAYPIIADTILKLKNGAVITFKDNISCNNILNSIEGTICEDNAVILEDNGSWRKWVKDHYASNYSYLKIKRGKVKVINQELTLFYRKWFLGKRIIIE